MAALKSHTPISARSPYFINCVPSTGTIVSATLVVTVQLGSRLASVTSMTDIKSYTITKTDAVDGIIVFDIAPLIRDFFENEPQVWTTAVNRVSNTGQVYFVKTTTTIVNSVSSQSPVDTYYTIKDAYADYKDGVNYLPSTGATGNYPFPNPVAYATDVTIMATDCYRQMGQDSYALVGFNTGEFERKNTNTRSWSRVKFGAGEDWKTLKASLTNVVTKQIAAVDDLATRSETVSQSLLYVALGKKNMLTDWISGQDYLRVGHFVYADNIGGTSSSLVEVVIIGGEIVDNGNDTVTLTVSPAPLAGQTVIDINMFDCGIYNDEVFAEFEVVSLNSTSITVTSQDTDHLGQLQCIAADGTIEISVFYLTSTGDTLIASINNQPTLRYEILCEPKYNVIDCVFINKWGCWDSFSFLKKSVQKLSVEAGDYRRSVGEVVSNAYSYDITKAQKVQYNKNGFKSITVNTGFVNESFNLLLEELMLSETIYLVIDDVFEPVILNTSTIEFKKGVNDKLINYTLDFDFAYNKIQAAL